MDMHAQLAELRQTVTQARSMPMSASVVVNRAEVLAQIDRISGALDEAVGDSPQVVSQREAVVGEGHDEADRIVADAHREREKILADADVHRAAQQQAEDLVAQARKDADELRQETDDYVDAKLANFEITLERTTEAVKRGRERLAGRSAFDGITSAEVDKITLPAHLER
jgi:cell division septum initiation protein DivIVA